jgi:hypothetical protein
VIIANSRPIWPSELTAWGTLAVAVVAVAIAFFAEWRASIRVISERDHAAKVLEDERKAADERLNAQMAHSDRQLQEERQKTQDALQLSEAYAIRVIVGQQDGLITDPNINAGPDDVLRSLAVVVVNESHYTVTDVAVGLFSSNGSMTSPARVERMTDSLLQGALEGPPNDMGDRTLAPGASGLRFAGSARRQHDLRGTYPLVRWTDMWGQMWENSKGRVRKTSASTVMRAWP